MPYLSVTEQLRLSFGDFLAKFNHITERKELEKLIDHKIEEVIRIYNSANLYISERQANAMYPFLTRSYLQMLRFRQQGPNYYKMHPGQNGRVYYRVTDIEQWLRKNKVFPPNKY